MFRNFHVKTELIVRSCVNYHPLPPLPVLQRCPRCFTVSKNIWQNSGLQLPKNHFYVAATLPKPSCMGSAIANAATPVVLESSP